MLTGIELAGFRNYRQLSLFLGPRANLFIGANGQGKTNLLEAVFFLAMLRSFRTSALRDLCAAGTNSFRLAGAVRATSTPGWTRQLEVVYGERRQLQLDGQPVRTAGEFIGQFRVVAFTPDDLRLVQGAATLRRRFLDMVLAPSTPAYLHSLQQYVEALRQRNGALRHPQATVKATAVAFEPILAEHGAILTVARRELVELLSAAMAERLSRILGRQSAFLLRYQAQADTADPGLFRERLATQRERDGERGYTGYGPHLDELVFMLDGHDLRHHGSSGQCRLAALCLKLAVLGWHRTTSLPDERGLIALVDEVTGELDTPTREAYLADLQVADQLLFTFTARPTRLELFPEVTCFKVREGTVVLEA